MTAKKNSPKVSCLLLNWNGINFTRKCLRSLLKTDYPNFEIIIVDNGSTEDEAGLLEKEFGKRVTIVSSKVNLGYAGGINFAYKKSTGDYVMFLNNDMEFQKDWLVPLVNILKENQDIGACQPKIKDLKAKENFEYAAAAGGYIDILGYTFARGRIFSAVEKDRGQYDQSVRVSWAGVVLVKRSVLKRTGLFDPLYFTYAEDVDLCYRISGQGYKIVYVPESVVYHYGGGVMGKNMARKMFFIHRNHLILIIKNWELQTLLLLIIPRVMLDGVSFIYYFVTGYRDISFALVRSYLSLFTMIPAIIKSRKSAQKIIKKENRSLLPLYKGSIVWDYFIRRKKIFKEIMDSDDHKITL